MDRIRAEAIDGAFCVLPRHVDCVTALVPGLLEFTADGQRRILAVDTGVLVKCGSEVLVSVRNAISGHEPGDLEERLRTELSSLDEHEKRARATIARLEADFVSQYYRMQEAV